MLGTPAILIDSVSLPSVAVSAEAIESGIEAPALPEAFCTFKVGVVATPAINSAAWTAAVERSASALSRRSRSRPSTSLAS